MRSGIKNCGNYKKSNQRYYDVPNASVVHYVKYATLLTEKLLIYNLNVMTKKQCFLFAYYNVLSLPNAPAKMGAQNHVVGTA